MTHGSRALPLLSQDKHRHGSECLNRGLQAIIIITNQATQIRGVSQPHKSDTRAPPAAESSSSHHSTPSKGKASTPRDSDQLLANANINGDTIKWLNEEGLGSIDHLKLLTLKSTKELCSGKSPRLPFG